MGGLVKEGKTPRHKGAAHNLNNTIAVGTLIQVKNAQSNDALVLTVTDGLTFCF